MVSGILGSAIERRARVPASPLSRFPAFCHAIKLAPRTRAYPE
jgi:hypothetical protein